MAYLQHHVWYVVPAWGHITSVNALIARTLHENPRLVVTYVTHNLPGITGEKLEADLSHYENLDRDRLNVMQVGDPSLYEKHGPEAIPIILRALAIKWIELLDTICSPSATWPNPTALILDQNTLVSTLEQSRTIVGNGCRVLAYCAGAASRLHGFLATSSEAGFGDWKAIAERYYNDEELRAGRDFEQIADQVFLAKNGTDKLNGSVIKIPGLSEMYDYEREFGEIALLPGTLPMLKNTVALFKDVDGIISASSNALEAPALEACNKITPVYAVGVQMAPRGWVNGKAELQDKDLVSFLNQFSENEVLVISFGSIFFPRNPDFFRAIIRALVESNFPFVLVLGGVLSHSALSQEDMSSIHSSPVGLVHHSWVDQQALLQHPSVGWLLFHGGFNSMVESLVQGVPMIGWPLSYSDQSLNVALGSTRESPFIFELLQIRTGAATGKPFRNGETIHNNVESVYTEFLDILRKARRSEGEVLRANAKALSAELSNERNTTACTVVRDFSSL